MRAEGRPRIGLAAPPRVVVGCFALDQHEAGALAVAAALRDAGAEVIYLGRFNLPPHFVAAAAQEDADIIGVSCHSWEYRAYAKDLLEELERQAIDASLVLGGSVITARDEAELVADGVAAVFGPGATESEILEHVWRLASARRAALPPN